MKSKPIFWNKNKKKKSSAALAQRVSVNYINDPIVPLTHCSLETPKKVISKQCRPRSNAAERGV